MRHLIQLTLSSALFAMSLTAAPKPKTAVCHFDEEAAAWVLLQLPAKAAENHLGRHDDAAPGGITEVTGTQLDDACLPLVNGDEEVPPAEGEVVIEPVEEASLEPAS